jgi:hypothetical protein
LPGWAPDYGISAVLSQAFRKDWFDLWVERVSGHAAMKTFRRNTKTKGSSGCGLDGAGPAFALQCPLTAYAARFSAPLLSSKLDASSVAFVQHALREMQDRNLAEEGLYRQGGHARLGSPAPFPSPCTARALPLSPLSL